MRPTKAVLGAIFAVSSFKCTLIAASHLLPALCSTGQGANPASIVVLDGIASLMGIGVLVAYARRYAPEAPVSDEPAMPGDGTNHVVSRAFLLATIVGGYAAYAWWARWCWGKGIPLTYTKTYLPFLCFIAVALLIVAVHELGHALTGVALGMELYSFCVGPFRWRRRGGRWQFCFRPAGFIAMGGATGVDPVRINDPSRDTLYVLAAGPLANLLTGVTALVIAGSADADSSWQMGGMLALFGVFSLTGFASNLIPFRTGTCYSDGAQICQLLARGPWADYQNSMSFLGASGITPLHPRDFDLSAVHRAATGIRQGFQAFLLRLVAYQCYLDRGLMAEAVQALKDAEDIYPTCASEIPAGLLPVMIFGNAMLRRDDVAARAWWQRMEDKQPAEFNADYWSAKAALSWIEGNLHQADKAWQKAHEIARQLPNCGAYEFDRSCCALLRRSLDASLVAS